MSQAKMTVLELCKDKPKKHGRLDHCYLSVISGCSVCFCGINFNWSVFYWLLKYLQIHGRLLL